MEEKALRNAEQKSITALKSPTMLYPSKKAEPQKTSNHMMTKHWEYFPSFTRFFISLCLEDALWRASYPLSKGLVQLPCDGDGYWLLVWKCCPTLKRNNTMNSDTCCPKLHYAAVVSFNLSSSEKKLHVGLWKKLTSQLTSTFLSQRWPLLTVVIIPTAKEEVRYKK